MILKLFAKSFWNKLSDNTHKINSKIFSYFFISKISRFIILPYCLIYGLSDDDLNYYYPESEATSYTSFGDFFKRKLKTFPQSNSAYVWPCEGYICDWGLVAGKNITEVKNQKISPIEIFQPSAQVSDNYFFTNIFLHNHNYHRIHAPVAGTIVNIKSISGGLTFLRPWFYAKDKVSWPALKNERLNIEILDESNRLWYISMVGGFGVGTIKTTAKTYLNNKINQGDELGWFELGSTVCMLSPVAISVQKYLQPVTVGSEIKPI